MKLRDNDKVEGITGKGPAAEIVGERDPIGTIVRDSDVQCELAVDGGKVKESETDRNAELGSMIGGEDEIEDNVANGIDCEIVEV
jgi:hypothetical protein